ncbi:uncharacterized protein MELLADRAFT_91238 [Melampsora larici-populina 98AG31]|uniref:Cell wall alpha-1,3-glucan synthase Mok11-14/Ags1-like transmembrane domain-containing protein n=1 Tax=Melampsora larici-populina (strain 98AG31 / pathotype 3-4-7) TaxID=747676 RepID=F4RYC0_MELLP|nr:uncharacterized protein MELLADRAFT_91238 [Melampsora larici-populina 98AG31]EGG02650.1 hypothetical protein MELLADRAFT_91238 [Melampsora larici-populina 98AG31]
MAVIKLYGGWPVYIILLALGQVLGATSFQLSLLGGTSSQPTFDLHDSKSNGHWLCEDYRIDLPVCFEQHRASFLVSFDAVALLIASSFYAFATAAGFREFPFAALLSRITSDSAHLVLFKVFFGINFGEEAGGASDTWVFRACVV